MPNKVMYRPVDYKQYDLRWGNLKYDTSGVSTIKSAGCGPTCAAMVISTLVKEVTPKDTCKWSLDHGYKYPSGGTYYSYVTAQLKEFGIESKQLNTTNIYKNIKDKAHEKALEHLKANGWLIACMGPGNWTKGGHYILVYGYKNGYVYVNDPASTAPGRLKASWELLRSQVKYYWTINLNPWMDQKKEFSKQTATPIQVMWLQERLNTFAENNELKNWEQLEVDGAWGTMTAKAVYTVRTFLQWKTGNAYKCTEKLIEKIR